MTWRTAHHCQCVAAQGMPLGGSAAIPREVCATAEAMSATAAAATTVAPPVMAVMVPHVAATRLPTHDRAPWGGDTSTHTIALSLSLTQTHTADAISTRCARGAPMVSPWSARGVPVVCKWLASGVPVVRPMHPQHCCGATIACDQGVPAYGWAYAAASMAAASVVRALQLAVRRGYGACSLRAMTRLRCVRARTSGFARG